MIKFTKIASVMVAALPLFWSGGASANTGYSLPGITPSGNPNFLNDVEIKYQRADNQSNKLTAVISNTTGTFDYFGTYYDVNNLSYKLRANFTNTSSPTFLGGSVQINGNLAGLGYDNGLLFRANLDGFNYNNGLIGFNTDLTGVNSKSGGNYFCAESFAFYCEASDGESVYLSGFGGGFDLGLKKFRADGMALTTVPVPAAVWLFGSGLLGLVSIAKRKRAAA